jgi:hypothetical protein
VPGCVCWVVVCACLDMWVDGLCLRLSCCACGLCVCSLGRNSFGAAGAAAIAAGLVHLPQLQTLKYVVCPVVCAGPWCVLAWERGAMACVRAGVVVCGLCSCSLYYNDIDDAGAAAIGAGLVHVSRLQTLEYAVCPAVCAGPWCVFAREFGSMACVRAGGVVCARLVFVQPWKQPYRCRGCSGHRCGPGPRASAADTEVRCVPGCVFGAVVCACAGMRTDGMCLRWRCCVCALCLCSLRFNSIGAVGAAAIGAGLVRVSMLQEL